MLRSRIRLFNYEIIEFENLLKTSILIQLQNYNGFEVCNLKLIYLKSLMQIWREIQFATQNDNQLNQMQTKRIGNYFLKLNSNENLFLYSMLSSLLFCLLAYPGQTNKSQNTSTNLAQPHAHQKPFKLKEIYLIRISLVIVCLPCRGPRGLQSIYG